MADLTAFAVENFDVRAWVNETCARRPENDPLERFLAEVEMRLHLTAEDVEAALEEASSRALMRIPTALEEVTHVKGDVAALKADVAKGLRQLETSSSAAGEAVASLAELDLVKSRMEAAASTLKEATELSELFGRVETIFAGTDFQRMAETLATMRRSLALVGDVPEFKAGQERLAGLEERFQTMVEPQLAGALAQKKGERVQNLTAMLSAIGRTATVERLYNSARLPPLQGFWDSFEGKEERYEDWLPRFYDQVLNGAEAESRWCASVLPDQHPRLVLHLLITLFARIDKESRSRIAAALDRGGSQALEVLIQLEEAAEAFSHTLERSLAGVPLEELTDIAAAVYSPLEHHIARYGELESKQLAGDLAAIALPDTAEDAEGVVAGLAASVPLAAAAAEAAVKRCLKLTRGSGLPALLPALDHHLSSYVGRLQAVLLALRQHCVPDEVAPNAAAGDTSALLPLLNVAGGLLASFARLSGGIEAAVAGLPSLLDASGPTSLEAVALRLKAPDARLRKEMKALVEAADVEGYVPLPTATSWAETFHDALHALVYDMLMIKVKAELKGVAELEAWSTAEAETGFNLPSFSTFPQPYVSAAGEYLMMLPQLLEALIPEPDAEAEPDAAEDSHVDADWLDKVAAGAAELYVAELDKVAQLSASGAQQLAADLEYFCNVLSALGVALPPSLATWQLAASWPPEEFPGAARAGLEDGALDQSALERVARARRLEIAPA